ncbi:MAG: hypothetical protein KDC35_01535 [Acidobacteria bacterium]|nr:hypothetical protein [Acidobacteriota bacterium]
MIQKFQVQASALALLLSGVLLISGWTLNAQRDSLIGASFAMAGYVLSGFGLTGLFAFQSRQTGWLGLFGWFAMLGATFLFIPFVFADIARLSGVAPGLDRKLIESSGGTFVIGAISGVAYMLGLPAYGIASLRARLLWRWPAFLLIAAAFMPLVAMWLGTNKLLARIAGLAFIGFGINLWRLAKSIDEA